MPNTTNLNKPEDDPIIITYGRGWNKNDLCPLCRSNMNHNSRCYNCGSFQENDADIYKYAPTKLS